MDFCFPHHNGHPAWPYLAETIEDAAIEDLFWRKMQTDSVFLKEVIKGVWPDANECQDGLLITPDLAVSLFPESHGAYAGRYPYNLNYLRGNEHDPEHIVRGLQDSSLGGYYTGPLIARKKGWLLRKVVWNLMQEDFLRDLKSNLKSSDRYHLYHKGGCYQQILMNEVPTDENVVFAINRAYPTRYGFSQGKVYWYRTEDGRTACGIVRFIDSEGNQYKLPLSAWQQTSNIRRSTIVYDTLNVAMPYPLYNLDRVVAFSGSRHAVICATEAYADYMHKEHGWLSNYIPVTAYSTLVGTDWSKINGRTPIIFADATTSGCYEAFRLHATLEKLGFQPRFIKRQNGAGLGSLKLDQDLMNAMAFDHDGCSFQEFVAHCHKEFGATPPEGVLPNAIPLSALPDSDVAQEPLMEGLLDTGDQMMIHAWRGVGKSLFAMLLGLCFASGKSALNGRVCPSRKYRVLLLDGEMRSRALKKRGYSLCSGHEVPQESMDALMVRSLLSEKKDLSLETDEGFKAYLPDLLWAEIIILDSVFKFFPMSMGADFERAGKLLELLHWCKEHDKTLILIDHEGKNRGASFGTMGKEIALDVVLQLCKADSGRVIKANVKKSRNYAELSGAYLEMQIDASESGRITFRLPNETKSTVPYGVEPLGLDSGVELPDPSAAHTSSLDEAIIEYVREHPDTTQGDMAAALEAKGLYGKRSTIQARIKVVSEAGKIPYWLKRPDSHKVAKQPVSEGGQN
ncbi:MAG: AAA family ATPase [Desulfovibrio sp.]|uniref:AAA family ATPase n=1 Tax=Desulfovibrio sp. TaxID=885 RepID=UPI001A777A67|nr:AAA family ATPase [Desulfovibrio sp.]MBD5418324.1 AAA family ATPase [Desulfovibrio sp.]